jgi:hypothetical protein
VTTTNPTAPDDTKPPPNYKFCPRGCASADWCKASLISPCPKRLWDTDNTGTFQPCGCLERAQCRDCHCCKDCVGCYCGEE